MVGRVIVLVTAVLVAALGALLVYLYAQSTIEDARAELEPVAVLVATQEIAAGTTVAAAREGGRLELVERPRDALPPGALSADDVDEVDGLAAATSVLPGEVLLRARLQDPSEGNEPPIGEQELAITLPLADPNRVAPFLEPGDEVAVFLTRQGGGGEDGDVLTPTTQVLVPLVTVIEVGASAQGDDLSNALVTVSVVQEDAQRLIVGQTLGELYLGLLREGEEKSRISPGARTSAENLFEVSP